MIKIAVCDDEPKITQLVEKYVLDWTEKHQCESHITVFYGGDALINALEQEDYFDMIFLDIEMGEKNGIVVGERLRRKLDNVQTLLIYVSAYEQYTKELCKLEPFDFLDKPLDVNALGKTLQRAIHRIQERKEQIFEFTVRKTPIRIPLRKILYFESQQRQIIVVTPKQTYEYYGKIDNVYEKVKNMDFLWVLQSFVINYEYIEQFGPKTIRLCNDKVIDISRVRKKEIYQQYLRMKEAHMDASQ